MIAPLLLTANRMMSTFDATSHHAFAFGDDRIDPIIRSGGGKRPQEISNSIGGYPSTVGQHQHRGGEDCQACIRQRPTAANAHRDGSNGGGGKRRRQSRDELQYAAAIAREEALLAGGAGRPADDAGVAESSSSPRPPDGVGVLGGGCGVATAREFDEMFGGGAGCDDYDLASMYAIAGLLRSARCHYGFSWSDDEAAATEFGNAAGPRTSRGNNCGGLTPTDKQPKSASGRYGAHAIIGTNANYDKKLSMNNSSHTLSSWTPSSGSSNRLNYYGGGGRGGSNIDNDNRSDGQSSDMAAGEGGGSSSSPSVYSDTSENGNEVDEPPQQTDADDKDNRGDFDGPYAVIG
jgi:hypothetical protein